MRFAVAQRLGNLFNSRIPPDARLVKGVQRPEPARFEHGTLFQAVGKQKRRDFPRIHFEPAHQFLVRTHRSTRSGGSSPRAALADGGIETLHARLPVVDAAENVMRVDVVVGDVVENVAHRAYPLGAPGTTRLYRAVNR